MADDEIVVAEKVSEAIVIRSDVLEKHDFGDVKLEKIVSSIVDEVIQIDVRISDTTETREALRDYIRMEIILSKKFEHAVNNPGSITTADERMIRSAVKMKMDIRNELYKDVKGKPGKEREIGLVREQVSKRVIKAAQEVDILE